MTGPAAHTSRPTTTSAWDTYRSTDKWVVLDGQNGAYWVDDGPARAATRPPRWSGLSMSNWRCSSARSAPSARSRCQHRPRSCRWRRSPSTSRWPTSTGRSTILVRRNHGGAGGAGVPRQGAVQRARRRRVPPRPGRAHTEHAGPLAALRRVVSAEAVALTGRGCPRPRGRRPVRRHPGRRAPARRPAPARPSRGGDAGGSRGSARRTPPDADRALGGRPQAGQPFLHRLASGQSPRAVWTAPAGADWPARLAAAAAATRVAGRGSIVCLPDARDVARVDAALTALLGPGAHVVLTADLGPAARCRAFLALLRGHAQIAVGTRAAAFAPVHDLGLVAMWDDGDDLFAELHAPYPHAREVLTSRAHLQQTAVLLCGHSRSVESQLLVESGWAVALSRRRASRLERPHRRCTSPAKTTASSNVIRLRRWPGCLGGCSRSSGRPWRRGRCWCTPPLRLPAGVGVCGVPAAGPLRALLRAAGHRHRQRPAAVPVVHAGRDRLGVSTLWWRCSSCSGGWFVAYGAGVGPQLSPDDRADLGGDRVLDTVDPQPAIVVATPGAEPRASPDGYAAAVLLDTWLTLTRPDFGAAEEALRRWFNAAALVRPGGDGGRVIAVGEPSAPALQALVRWDPAGFATRELADRRSAHLPPAARVATITAPAEVMTEALGQLTLPPRAEVLGPVDIGREAVRLVVRTPSDRGRALTRALQHLQATRSSRKLPPVRVQVDPAELV